MGTRCISAYLDLAWSVTDLTPIIKLMKILIKITFDNFMTRYVLIL